EARRLPYEPKEVRCPQFPGDGEVDPRYRAAQISVRVLEECLPLGYESVRTPVQLHTPAPREE
ncbi:hypothetical protein SARC_14626, partial [Sphaeroforma arctica JP610]